MNTCQVIDENRNNFIKSYSFDNSTIVCHVNEKDCFEILLSELKGHK